MLSPYIYIITELPDCLVSPFTRLPWHGPFIALFQLCGVCLVVATTKSSRACRSIMPVLGSVPTTVVLSCRSIHDVLIRCEHRPMPGRHFERSFGGCVLSEKLNPCHRVFFDCRFVFSEGEICGKSISFMSTPPTPLFFFFWGGGPVYWTSFVVVWLFAFWPGYWTPFVFLQSKSS